MIIVSKQATDSFCAKKMEPSLLRNGSLPMLYKINATSFSVTAMLILVFPEIGRHHPPPPLSVIRMFRPISWPNGRNKIICKQYANNKK